MKLKNSPAAIAAIGHALTHLTRARLELQLAERELERVRGLILRTFITDCGALKFISELQDSLRARKAQPLGMRTFDETPEEGPALGAPGLRKFLAAVRTDASGQDFVDVEYGQTVGDVKVRAVSVDIDTETQTGAPFDETLPSTPVLVPLGRRVHYACKRCGEWATHSAVEGGGGSAYVCSKYPRCDPQWEKFE